MKYILEKMVLCLCFVLLIFQTSCASSVHDFFMKDLLNTWVYPNLGKTNSLCRNHSHFYLDELEKLKLWATEMYDATAKFPSGILHGSPYALGHFDECLDIKVPSDNHRFFGKYCMTKIILTPNFKYKISKVDFEFGDYNDFYNVSAFSKMLAYLNEDSKASRNEIYFSFCLPSSCSEMDLQESLSNITTMLNSQFSDFSLRMVVKDKCQVKSDTNVFSAGNTAFIIFIVFSAVLVIFCSIYDMCSRSEDCFIKLKKAPGKLHDIFVCFSVPKNLKKLSSSTDNQDGLDCLAGVKVISMFLIIMGHRCMFSFGAPVVNPLFIERMYSRFEATAILNGPIIVDTFFLISGFLASYFTLSALKSTTSILNIILIYLHRFIRMTPTYAIVLAFYSTVFASLGSGPFWEERVGVEKERCLQSWWTNLLYINNYVNVNKLCMFQSWYITCDIHYFLLIPLIVIILKKNEFWGVSAILGIIISSILIVLASVYINNGDAILLLYMKLLRDPISSSTFKNIYIPSHMRASPYFVGVMTGYIKYKMKNSAYKLPKWLYRTAWVVATFISLATIHLGFIFYLPQFSKTSVIAAIYAGFHHFTFSAGNAWLIIAVSSGKGPWIEPLLSWKPFILLSRISYTAFLCHGGIQLYTAAVMRQPNYATIFSTFYATFGDIVMAYSFGFLLSMVFEAPIIGLEKIILGGKKDQYNARSTEVIEEIKTTNAINSNSEKSITHNNDIK